MHRFILSILAAAALVALAPRIAPAQIGFQSVGDTTLTAGASFKIFPCMCRGGGKIHNSQFYTTDNVCGPATRGYLFTRDGDIRVRIFGAATIDTSGFTIPAGGNYGSIPVCDSILVLSTSTVSTRLTWGLFR